jgi:transformation/transcription domain-associated protein
MVWFRECWHEEVLRQLRQVLTKCYQVAFETRTDGMSYFRFPFS